MKQEDYKKMDPLVEILAERFVTLNESGKLDELLAKLKAGVDSLPQAYGLDVTLHVEAFHDDREESLLLLETGFVFPSGEEPYRCCDGYGTQAVFCRRRTV